MDFIVVSSIIFSSPGSLQYGPTRVPSSIRPGPVYQAASPGECEPHMDRKFRSRSMNLPPLKETSIRKHPEIVGEGRSLSRPLRLDLTGNIVPEGALLPFRAVWLVNEIADASPHDLSTICNTFPVHTQWPSARFCHRQKAILKVTVLANNDISCEGCRTCVWIIGSWFRV